MSGANPRSQKVTFTNAAGESLAARLDLPPLSVGGGEPQAYAIFAHCFTCSKDFPAASRISRGLAERGFGVLRFDFTGLGSSDGDFANTNFSSNVDDLVHATEYMAVEHGMPRLLVGHSLGGAAVLAAARRIDSIEAVVTIGAPADPAHVIENFGTSKEVIERDGSAQVSLAGRAFTIKKQFLDDLGSQKLGSELGALDAALLVMHGPLDRQVHISEAKKIYEAARGYKSFVTLADADHLLSRREDADYASDVIAAWARRYVSMDADDSLNAIKPAAGGVVVDEIARPFTNRVLTAEHEFVADEPAKVGGADAGPAPFELLLASLGACTSMTIRMYADRKEWPLEHVRVTLQHERRKKEGGDGKELTEHFERVLEFEGPLTDEQRERLTEIAGRCPVHRALEHEKEIVTRQK